MRIIQFHGAGTTPGNYTGNEEMIKPATDSIVWDGFNQLWKVSFSITGFSGFYLSSTAAVLPLDLVSFTAAGLNCATTLQWKTQNEMNVSHFEAEYSPDGNRFITIATVTAKNTLGQQTYSYQTPTAAEQNYYRLKMVDKDGTITYSDTKVVTADCLNAAQNIYPNPVNDFLTLTGVPDGVTINLFNTTGQRLQSRKLNGRSQKIDMRNFADGVYHLVISNTAGNVIKTFKVIKLGN